MKIPVNINITKKTLPELKRIRACDNADGDEYVSDYEGTMTIVKNEIKLNYIDHDNVSVEETIRDGKCRFLTISAAGRVMASLAFEQGKSFICYFPTGEHADFVRIDTKKFESFLTKDGGYIYVEYLSEVPEYGAERYELTMRISPTGKFLRS